MGHYRASRPKKDADVACEPALLSPDADAVEWDESCVGRKQNLWLWTAVSRHTAQILTYRLGDRTWVNARHLRDTLPTAWHKRRVYTDRYKAYETYLARSRHVPSDKGEGKTSVVEGVNNSLRHRCSLLERVMHFEHV